MRPLLVVLVSSTVLLAGCTGAPSSEKELSTPDDEPGPEALGNVTGDAEVPAPIIEVRPVHWNGTLGTSLFACEYQTSGVCHGQVVAAGDTDTYVEGPGIVRAVDLTLSWTASSAATERLHFGVMTMGSCDGCTSAIKTLEGSSPLKVMVDGLDLPMDDEAVVHAYVFNPTLFHHQAPIVLYASLDEAVRIEGTVTLETAAPA